MKLRLLFMMCIIAVTSINAQVGIGITVPEAGLDITSTSTGLLIPRVSLTSLAIEAPVLNPAGGSIPISTLIFHDGSNSLATGFYYWDGTQWVILTTGESSDWTILGNTGTTPGTNFIGTTDTQDFVIRTDNIERARVLSGGNVGIGITAPTAKTHINQTAAINALVVDHSGTSGNSLELIPTDASNGSSTLWIRNGSDGPGINNDMNSTTSTATGIIVDQSGLGSGMTIFNTNSGASGTSLYIEQDGTDTFSRGIDTYMDVANTATGYSLFHDGTGIGTYTGLTNAANASTGNSIIHDGTGMGQYIKLSNTASPSTTQYLDNNGLGNGQYITLDNVVNSFTGQYISHSGVGTGQYINLSNTATTATASFVHQQGVGAGMYVLSNNTASDTNYSGMTVVYEGTGTGGTGGGGNTLELQHNGTNSNAFEVFIGDPQSAPGPANTTSDYSSISATQMATGTSGAANTKSAVAGYSNSADPTIVATNNGTEVGSAIEAYVTPNFNDPIAIAGYAYNATSNGYGIGVRGSGRWYGVHGQQSGGAGNFAVYGSGDYGGTGAKFFSIDHPLDPENKILNHYSIESNEITNMYRGIVQLDDSGKAVVKLPEYFDAANKEPSYQLTPIGTSSQPYILKEEANNQFTVGGAPNTKVSWTVFAKRNDATIQYFDRQGKNYNQEEQLKPAKMRGKYYTPEAYGKDKTQGIHYNAQHEVYAKKVKSITAKKLKKIKPKASASEKPKTINKKKEKIVSNKE